MGAASSFIRKTANNWNATNRAVKYLEKTSVVRASKAQHKIVPQFENDLQREISQRNVPYEKRVSAFEIESHPVRDSILPEGVDYVQHSSRKLPQRIESGNPLPLPNVQYGFAVPDVVPVGKLTMHQAISLVKQYQRKTKTIEDLALEYRVPVDRVTSICKYYSLFEADENRVWVPPSEKIATSERSLLDQPIAAEDDDDCSPEEISRYARLHKLEKTPANS